MSQNLGRGTVGEDAFRVETGIGSLWGRSRPIHPKRGSWRQLCWGLLVLLGTCQAAKSQPTGLSTASGKSGKSSKGDNSGPNAMGQKKGESNAARSQPVSSSSNTSTASTSASHPVQVSTPQNSDFVFQDESDSAGMHTLSDMGDVALGVNYTAPDFRQHVNLVFQKHENQIKVLNTDFDVLKEGFDLLFDEVKKMDGLLTETNPTLKEQVEDLYETYQKDYEELLNQVQVLGVSAEELDEFNAVLEDVRTRQNALDRALQEMLQSKGKENDGEGGEAPMTAERLKALLQREEIQAFQKQQIQGFAQELIAGQTQEMVQTQVSAKVKQFFEEEKKTLQQDRAAVEEIVNKYGAEGRLIELLQKGAEEAEKKLTDLVAKQNKFESFIQSKIDEKKDGLHGFLNEEIKRLDQTRTQETKDLNIKLLDTLTAMDNELTNLKKRGNEAVEEAGKSALTQITKNNIKTVNSAIESAINNEVAKFQSQIAEKKGQVAELEQQVRSGLADIDERFKGSVVMQNLAQTLEDSKAHLEAIKKANEQSEKIKVNLADKEQKFEALDAQFIQRIESAASLESRLEQAFGLISQDGSGEGLMDKFIKSQKNFQNQSQTLVQRLENMEEELSGRLNDAQGVASKAETVKKHIEGLDQFYQSQSDVLKQNVQSMTDARETYDQLLGALKGRAEAIDTNLAGHQHRLKHLSEQIEGVTTDVNKNLDAFNEEVDKTLQEQGSKIKQWIDTSFQKVQTDVGQQAQALQTQISQIEQQAGGARSAAAQQIQDLRGLLAQAGQQQDAVQALIGQYRSEMDRQIQVVNEGLAQAKEQREATNRSAVEAKELTTHLQTAQTALGEAQDRLQEDEDALKQRVKQALLDALPIDEQLIESLADAVKNKLPNQQQQGPLVSVDDLVARATPLIQESMNNEFNAKKDDWDKVFESQSQKVSTVFTELLEGAKGALGRQFEAQKTTLLQDQHQGFAQALEEQNQRINDAVGANLAEAQRISQQLGGFLAQVPAKVTEIKGLLDKVETEKLEGVTHHEETKNRANELLAMKEELERAFSEKIVLEEKKVQDLIATFKQSHEDVKQSQDNEIQQQKAALQAGLNEIASFKTEVSAWQQTFQEAITAQLNTVEGRLAKEQTQNLQALVKESLENFRQEVQGLKMNKEDVNRSIDEKVNASTTLFETAIDQRFQDKAQEMETIEAARQMEVENLKQAQVGMETKLEELEQKWMQQGTGYQEILADKDNQIARQQVALAEVGGLKHRLEAVEAIQNDLKFLKEQVDQQNLQNQQLLDDKNKELQISQEQMTQQANQIELQKEQITTQNEHIKAQKEALDRVGGVVAQVAKALSEINGARVQFQQQQAQQGENLGEQYQRIGQLLEGLAKSLEAQAAQ